MSVPNQEQQQQQEQQPALASSKAWVGQAREQLGQYGYGLTDDHYIERNGRVLGVVVEQVRGRFRALSAKGGGPLLWSGANLGHFCRDFWFATKVENA